MIYERSHTTKPLPLAPSLYCSKSTATICGKDGAAVLKSIRPPTSAQCENGCSTGNIVLHPWRALITRLSREHLCEESFILSVLMESFRCCCDAKPKLPELPFQCGGYLANVARIIVVPKQIPR